MSTIHSDSTAYGRCPFEPDHSFIFNPDRPEHGKVPDTGMREGLGYGTLVLLVPGVPKDNLVLGWIIPGSLPDGQASTACTDTFYLGGRLLHLPSLSPPQVLLRDGHWSIEISVSAVYPLALLPGPYQGPVISIDQSCEQWAVATVAGAARAYLRSVQIPGEAVLH